jgi:hypothetical protein
MAYVIFLNSIALATVVQDHNDKHTFFVIFYYSDCLIYMKLKYSPPRVDLGRPPSRALSQNEKLPFPFLKTVCIIIALHIQLLRF